MTIAKVPQCSMSGDCSLDEILKQECNVQSPFFFYLLLS